MKADDTEAQKLNGFLRLLVMVIPPASFLFHVFGGVVVDIETTSIYRFFLIHDLVDVLKSTPRYAPQVSSFIEFVLVIYLQIFLVAVLILAITIRRLLSSIGLFKSATVEKTTLYLTILAFFFVALHPYVLPWPGGYESDKTLILSLNLQMFIQTVLWMCLLAASLACLFSPARTHMPKTELAKRK